LFTGDLEKDKKIKQIHKVWLLMMLYDLIEIKYLEITTNQRS
jgi:hypothetical protein